MFPVPCCLPGWLAAWLGWLQQQIFCSKLEWRIVVLHS